MFGGGVKLQKFSVLWIKGIFDEKENDNPTVDKIWQKENVLNITFKVHVLF